MAHGLTIAGGVVNEIFWRVFCFRTVLGQMVLPKQCPVQGRGMPVGSTGQHTPLQGRLCKR